MIERQVVVGEQLDEDRRQVAAEGHSPAKRGRRGGSAGDRVAAGRARAWQTVVRAHCPSGRGGAPLPAARRACHEDVVRLASPCRLRRRGGAPQHSNALSARGRPHTCTCARVTAVCRCEARLQARPSTSCGRRSNQSMEAAPPTFETNPLMSTLPCLQIALYVETRVTRLCSVSVQY